MIGLFEREFRDGLNFEEMMFPTVLDHFLIHVEKVNAKRVFKCVHQLLLSFRPKKEKLFVH